MKFILNNNNDNNNKDIIFFVNSARDAAKKKSFLRFYGLVLLCTILVDHSCRVSSAASDTDNTIELKAKVKLFWEIKPKHTYHFSGCHIPLSGQFLSRVDPWAQVPTFPLPRVTLNGEKRIFSSSPVARRWLYIFTDNSAMVSSVKVVWAKLCRTSKEKSQRKPCRIISSLENNNLHINYYLREMEP